MTRVRFKNIVKRFGDTLAIDEVSLDVRPGELFTLVGPSGCGKIILLHIIARLLEQDAVRVLFNEHRMGDVPSYLRNIAVIFQNYAIFSHLTVGENIAYGLKTGRRSSAHAFLDALIMLAYAIPGTVVGVGLIVVYNRPPVILTGTWIILLVSYFIRHLPDPVRSCTAMLQQIDIRVEEASVSLGVPPFRTFLTVTIPLMFPAILSGAALAWMTTIGELSSSILLYSGPWATMSVAIFTEVFSNHFGTASALASSLIAAAFVPLFLTYRVLGERAALGV
jgi:iron(III) transport system permease protein